MSKARSQPLDADACAVHAKGSVRPVVPRKQGREAIPDLLCCPLTQVSTFRQGFNHALNLSFHFDEPATDLCIHLHTICWCLYCPLKVKYAVVLHVSRWAPGYKPHVF